jgi:hypothetical protein
LKILQHLGGVEIEQELLEVRSSWFIDPAAGAAIADRFLAIHNSPEPESPSESDDSYTAELNELVAPFSLIPVRDGYVDFRGLAENSEVEFVGDLLVPFEDLLK